MFDWFAAAVSSWEIVAVGAGSDRGGAVATSREVPTISDMQLHVTSLDSCCAVRHVKSHYSFSEILAPPPLLVGV